MKFAKLISLLLALIMVMGTLAACTIGDETETSSSSETDSVTETSSTKETDSTGETESSSENSSESNSVDTTETETTEETTDAEDEVLFQGPSAELINHANKLANNIDVGFTNAKRTDFFAKNRNMSFSYHVDNNSLLMNGIYSTNGNPYLTNTMDMFVTTESGTRYYASSSTKRVSNNFFRFGYYYYDIRFENQNFMGGVEIEKAVEVPFTGSNIGGNQVKTKTSADGKTVTGTITSTKDPFVVLGAFEKNKYPTADYDYLVITIKTVEDLSEISSGRSFSVYAVAGDKINYNDPQRVDFSVIPDGKYRDYYVPLTKFDDFTGVIKKLRLDFSGNVGDTYEIAGVKLINSADTDALENLSIARTFHVYSDKLHHSVQFSADMFDVTGIKNVGMRTEIAADTVAKLIVHDKNGNHDSLDKVNWGSVEYVAFDIKGAGIFGYILPADNSGGTLKVTLEDGKYVIEQTSTPENGTIKPSGYWDIKSKYYESVPGGEKNANDFIFAQRLYTDATHTFDKFLVEAEFERNPLTGKDIKVSKTNSYDDDAADFLGYDAIRGIYVLNVSGDGFNNPFYLYPNRHYGVNFDIASKGVDREIYIMTYNSGGNLECAALLNDKEMMLPVPIEVCKNFSEPAGERDIYNIDDATFSEAIIPLYLKADTKYEYTLVNLYQNWGKFPLKQLSSISFYTPYYHLSTGTTETNCIVPWYGLSKIHSLTTLPDHRGMSAPHWQGQPQHDSCGSHTWLEYTDSDGVYNAADCVGSYVYSYGPVYADTIMNYYSYDEKIKLSYVHMEMPQTDENRGYYEMRYEVLEDVSITDFANDFTFFTLGDNERNGYYTKMGYLDKDNKYQYTDAVSVLKDVDRQQFVLGTESPYFSFFDMEGGDTYSNVAFLVKDYEVNLADVEGKPNFIITNFEDLIKISFDLKAVTLRKGDTISINAIVVPWGSQEMEEDGDRSFAHAYTDVINEATGELYMDKNVRDIRENSCIDYFKATSETDEIIESPFLARVRSKNGKTATFTLSGGENNMAVRVYGFDMLTVPKIEELVGDKWVEYEVNSINSPDLFDYAHQYDGYNVYYDPDNTISYAFIVDMTGDVERTFRVSAEKEFEGWEKVVTEQKEDPLTLFFDAKDIYAKTVHDQNLFNTKELTVENDRLFLHLGSKEGRSETYFYLQGAKKEEDIPASGRYLAIRYRLPKENAQTIKSLEFYFGDLGFDINKSCFNCANCLMNDGEWHVMIIDIADQTHGSVTPNADGEYAPAFIRWDVFNGALPNDIFFDVEYIGLDGDLDKIIEYNSDLETVTLYSGGQFSVYSTETKKVISNENPADVPPKPTEADTPIKHTITLEALQMNIAAQRNLFQNVEIVNGEYLSVQGIGGTAEAYATVYSNNLIVTGQYMIFKYRMPTTNNPKCKSICVYTNTTGKPAGDYLFSFPAVNDNEWHIVIVDMSKGGTAEKFAPNADGKYVMTTFRLDLFDYKTEKTETEKIDIATLAFTDDLNVAITNDKTLETVSVYDIATKSVTTYKTADGSKVE